MASLISGYDYDIFVSYRKKDNKYDGWVTEFVDNLRKELEATFKEQVTVYFDENAFDGIQEIHNVDLSLERKLKALVFIPIVSQTYCDPQSYAWKNELLQFRQLAAADDFGLQIALANGNVASRIVPVRIHELDDADRLTLERELGGPLRSIDFIYSGSGVNRPLRATEENLSENERKTSYRNQINKTANLLKDLIQSMRAPRQRPDIAKAGSPTTPLETRRPVKQKILAAAGLIVIAAVIGFLFVDRIKAAFITDDRVAVSLAVMPFKVIGEEDGQYLADGVAENLLSNLRLFPRLRVKSRTSVEKYRGSQLSVAEIGRELDVLYILEGSTQKIGENIRIIVQLVDATKDEGVWSQKFDFKIENVFQIQNQISEVIAKSLNATLTPDISEKLHKAPTNNFEAYDLFLRSRQFARSFETTGNPAHLTMAKSLLKQSLERDPEFAQGYAWLAALEALSMDGPSMDPAHRDSVYLLARHAIQLDSSVVEANLVLSEIYSRERDDVNALYFTYRALEEKSLDSASAVRLVMRLAEIYSRLGFVSRAVDLLDMLSAENANSLEVLHLKFYPLASAGSTDELSDLSAAIAAIAPEDKFLPVLRLHQLLLAKDYNAIAGLYDKLKDNPVDQWNAFDQHVIPLAAVLRMQGKMNEAQRLLTQTADQFVGNEYVLAQIALLHGRDDQALQMLSDEVVGWFNLSFCEINPVFDHVRSDERFVEFIEGNKIRIENERIRVTELEGRGFLPTPEDFFTPVTESALGNS